MESLYTKYRPQTFDDVVGQKHVVTTLEHAVLEGRTSHAYLFCGPRGTGKTTMARLLAKALLCEQGAGHLPDGTCEECQQIAAGEHPDVYELDAASRTGVDNVREEIISRVSFAPARGAYKMYIIDEVHMLTTAAFNALLKTLEEPPSHVVFVLCTTDPQKIPETILSRVQRFDFHAISNADIQERLTYICEREGFEYDPEAIELVVRHARGGMRDAISELEQLSVSGGGTISVDVARDVLGEVSASTLERMSLAMANRDVPKLFAQVESLVEVGRDLLQFTRALAGRLRDVYVVAAIGESSGIVAASDDELPAISKEAKAFGSVDRVARALSLLSDASTEMRVAPNQRLVLEVALTKIARPQTELTLEALADRVSSLERQVAALSTPSARKQMEAPAKDMREAKPRPQGTTDRDAQESERQAQPVREAPTDGRPGEGAPTHKAEARETIKTAAANPQDNVRQERPGAVAQVADTRFDRTSAPVQAQSMPSQPATAATMRQAPQPSAAQPVQNGRERQAWESRQRPQTSQAAVDMAPRFVRQEERRPAQAAPSVQDARPSSPTPAVIMDPGELQRRWKQVVDGLLASRPQHGSLLMSSTVIADDGKQLMVSLPKGSMFACRMLERADVRASVDPMIAQVFGPRKTYFGEGLKAPAVSPANAPATTSVEPAKVVPTRQEAPKAPPSTSARFEPAPSPVGPAQRVESPTPAERPAQSHTGTSPIRMETVPAQSTAPAETTPATNPAASRRSNQAPQAASTQHPEPSAQQAPAPAAQPSQAAQTYPAPWDPIPLGEDDVPYDDADFTPYEEDFAFDPLLAAQFAAPTAPAPQMRASRVESQQIAAPTAPAPATPQHVVASPEEHVAETTSASVFASQAQQEPQPMSTSPRRSSPVVEASQHESASAPMPDAKPEPQSSPESAVASQPETAPTTQSSAKPERPATKPRRRQRAAGIPADIISMMTEIFGEGVTYTSLPSEDEDAEENVLDDGATPYDEGESEFVEEPVDDADYDDED